METARQIALEAEAGEILVSATVRDLVSGSGIQFQAKGSLGRSSAAGELQLLTVVPDLTY